MALLRTLQPELGFDLEELDITTDERLHRAYFERIPVVLLDGQELCEYFVEEALLRERLESRRGATAAQRAQERFSPSGRVAARRSPSVCRWAWRRACRATCRC